MTDQELNEAVAIKLGWQKYQPNPAGVPGWFRKNDFGNPQGHLPDYVHDIKAAWEIVEKWVADGHTFEIRFDPSQKQFRVSWMEPVYADTAPMAICKAFLKLEDTK